MDECTTRRISSPHHLIANWHEPFRSGPRHSLCNEPSAFAGQAQTEDQDVKKILIAAGTATLGLIAIAASIAPAAAAGCYYRLYHDGHGVVTGTLAIQGYATALKLDNACDRARRECNRRFERARKKGNVPRANPRDLRCIRTSAG